MSPEERLARAERARLAFDEFIAPALLVVKADYGNRMLELAEETVGQEAKIARLALALKISRVVESHVKAAMADGVAARAEIDRAQQIAKIPEHRRSLLGLG